MKFPDTHKTFSFGQPVQKKRGSEWHGTICGWYINDELTPEGYVVKSEREKGSCQLYPASALELVEPLAETKCTHCIHAPNWPCLCSCHTKAEKSYTLAAEPIGKVRFNGIEYAPVSPISEEKEVDLNAIVEKHVAFLPTSEEKHRPHIARIPCGSLVCPWSLRPTPKPRVPDRINGSFKGRMALLNAHENMLEDLYFTVNATLDYLRQLEINERIDQLQCSLENRV